MINGCVDVFQVYCQGSGKDCRKQVQSSNLSKGKVHEESVTQPNRLNEALGVPIYKLIDDSVSNTIVDRSSHIYQKSVRGYVNIVDMMVLIQIYMLLSTVF